MKLYAVVHGFVPEHGAGAEWMLHDMLKYLVDKGHEATVYRPKGEPTVFNGIKVTNQLDKQEIKQSDVLISHLNLTGQALNLSRELKKPLIWIAHNTHHYGIVSVRRHNVGIIYNSQYVKDGVGQYHKNQPGMILNPPCDINHYKIKNRGSHVTLVNINDAKGGATLKHLAEAMPNEKFLGVKGGYGNQVLDQPKNVKIVENMADIRKAYAKSRIVMMPSRYESWGRVAVEAMSCGIPVIANPTPGLQESLGDAGYFVKFNDVQGHIDAIKDIDANYPEWQEKVKLRSVQLYEQSQKQLAEFEGFVQKMSKWNHT